MGGVWEVYGRCMGGVQEVDNVIPPRPLRPFPHGNATFRKSSLCHPFDLWPTVNATNP